ncbi:unnamed protein product [Acanthoscelides obtectus]|uniref:Strictosidine synthase conserved region domain-containing protein n=1 Tax=Acanthoscelides obtectus TaxID=200917 RepID=A0A9P0KXR9_ACAOB|nr:unnamed protein product [Acanthoscelides obtectus]CAK1642345.1 Adipocyte plasma membrane-associated protein [Acanthoscelides obtectus]
MGAAKAICKFFFRRFLEVTIVCLLLLFMPNVPPYTKIEEPYTVAPTRPLEGKLVLKESLSDVEIWHKGDLIGPEGFAEYNGELYSSLATGEVVKLTGEHITPVVKFGKPCKGAYEERICGRPLGMQFDKNGLLIVADAYYGLFRVNVKTGDKELLVSPDQEIEGKKVKVFNSVALASNGDIYWSASSTEFTIENGVLDLLADPSGRLLHYDVKTKKNKVLIDKIHFANGVQLSDDEEFVIISETPRNRIHRYYLKGSKKGVHDIFIDGLPGMPDNLKSDGKGGFFVPLIVAVDSENKALPQIIGPYPAIRKIAARFLGVIQLIFKTVDKHYPNEFSQKAIHYKEKWAAMVPAFLPAYWR